MMNVVKKSWVYQTAILALIAREEDPETRELSVKDFMEAIYELASDWHWAIQAENREEANANEEALKETSRVSEEYSEKSDTSLSDAMNELRRKMEVVDND